MSGLSPPSTANSSAASSAEQLPAPPPTTMGSKRERPLQPPRPLFQLTQQHQGIDSTEDVRRDPFRTPDISVPPTPRSGVSNPFSPPASVVNFSADNNILHHNHSSAASIASTSYFPEPTSSPPASRPHTGASRVSVHSSLRNSTTDLHIREVTRGIRSRKNSSTHVRSSFMSPPALPRRATFLEGESISSGTLPVIPRAAKRQRSSMLTGEVIKPWATDRDFYERLSYYVTYFVAMLGIAGAIIRVYFSWVQTPNVGNLCLVMEDNFETFDTKYTWTHEVDMSGFG